MSRNSSLTGRQKVSSKDSIIFNNLIKEMDNAVVESFTPVQLKALKKAVQIREWRKHSVDFRPTLALPFIPWSFYLVLLVGINRRSLSGAEKFLAAAMFLLIIFLSGLSLLGLAFLLLYLIKSWLGIDIFSGSSLGLWDEFKNLFK